jgi:hypothetical protein
VRAQSGVGMNEVRLDHDAIGRQPALDKLLPGELGERDEDVSTVRSQVRRRRCTTSIAATAPVAARLSR